MPYRSAPYWVAGVIAVILAGFWPSYWSILDTSRWQFHLHGAISSLWVLMVLFQSWAVQKKQLPLHRTVGTASLFLFPVLIGGLMGIIDVTAKNFLRGDSAENPVTMMLGPAFLTGLLVAVAAYLTLYYRALKHRRSVWSHAGYMLGTPIILFESPFSRLLDIAGVPAFAVRGPADFDKILPSILFSDALAVAFCLVVYLRFGPRAKPFLVTAMFVALQMLVMATTGDIGLLQSALRGLGNVPSWAMVASGIAMGAAASWLGWRAGGAERTSALATQAPASA
ncbi:hypothetical protein G7076_10085 [Sphingomonas sp. HDW15A]|uniref:hypothetical protein n=1 Tax=Sphingomonas sp. HDW15A TaxID=2714942 RepID=UPI00140763BB|nr:hypothetical protein [Sphingomonas sp. HDW15A]QIK96738.1 hypothetical protein G7076_10085 [Sphingomonas sp. HDW15A]